NASLALESNTNNFLDILAPDANETGVLFGRPGSSVPNAAGGIIYNDGSTVDGLQFRTGGNVTRMVVTSAGNAGVGTVAPSARLHVEVSDSGGAAMVRANNSADAAASMSFTTQFQTWRIGQNRPPDNTGVLDS